MLLEATHKDGSKGQYVYLIGYLAISLNKNSPAKEIKLAPSGNGYIKVLAEGGIDAYGKSSSTYNSRAIEAFYPDDQSDAFIVREKSGLYSLSKTGETSNMLRGQDHIEFDSTGTIAVGKSAQGLTAFNLKTGKPINGGTQFPKSWCVFR